MNLTSLASRGYITPPYYKIIPLESASASVEVELDVEVGITVDPVEIGVDVSVEEDLNVTAVVVCED